MAIETDKPTHILHCTQLARRFRDPTHQNSYFPGINIQVATLHETVQSAVVNREYIDKHFPYPAREVALLAHDKIIEKQEKQLENEDVLDLEVRSNRTCSPSVTDYNFRYFLQLTVVTSSAPLYDATHVWRVIGEDIVYPTIDSAMQKINERGMRIRMRFRLRNQQ